MIYALLFLSIFSLLFILRPDRAIALFRFEDRYKSSDMRVVGLAMFAGCLYMAYQLFRLRHFL